MNSLPSTADAAVECNLPPTFDAAFRRQLGELFRWRRDVRRFKSDPLPADSLGQLLQAASLAPSVGLSQPWRFVQVEDPQRREKVRQSFRACNRQALEDYHGERARLYASLKLAGLTEAPLQLAVFCDEGTERGRGLGRRTMPETLHYSVVAAIQNLWLAARSLGIGVGWVSILDPEAVRQALELLEDWRFIAYLCIGFPQEEHLDPELERHNWEAREDPARHLLKR